MPRHWPKTPQGWRRSRRRGARRWSPAPARRWLAAARAQLGQQVQTAAGKELASDGNVGNSVAKLTQHSSALTQQQKAMLTLQQSTGLSVYQRASG